MFASCGPAYVSDWQFFTCAINFFKAEHLVSFGLLNGRLSSVYRVRSF